MNNLMLRRRLMMAGRHEPPAPPENGYITFTGKNGDYAGTWALHTNTYAKTWDGIVEISTDAINWVEWNGNTFNCSADGKIYVRGKNNTIITGGDDNRQYTWSINVINISALYCDGNIMTLLDYESPSTAVMGANCFRRLFRGWQQLKTAPTLPATQLSANCYDNMFRESGLVIPPSLPATTLATLCYRSMFYSCTSLTTAPALPATNLAEYCYSWMFGLSGIVEAPELPTATNSSAIIGCYNCMFNSCTSLVSAPSKIEAAYMGNNYCYQMFYGCTSLTIPPNSIICGDSIGDYGCYQMFKDCTNLETAPTKISATRLCNYCCYGAFSGCTKLKTPPSLPTTSLNTAAYQYMFSVCTSLDKLPILPCTYTVPVFYSDMFNGCSKIRLSATQSGDYTVQYQTIPYGGDTTQTPVEQNNAGFMFSNTGGEFTGTPFSNTMYYLHNTNSVVPAS